MKKKILSVILSTAMMLPYMNVVMAEDVDTLINAANTTEKMREAVTSNAEELGVDADYLKNMTVVYRDLAKQVAGGTRFDTETFKTAFYDVTDGYLTKEQYDPAHYLYCRNINYNGAVEEVIIDTQKTTSSYGGYYLCGYDLPELTDVKKIKASVYYDSFNKTGTTGWLKYDIGDYPVEMTAGTYAKETQVYTDVLYYLRNSGKLKNIIEMKGANFPDLPYDGNYYKGDIVVDLTDKLATIKNGEGTFILSGGAGENVQIYNNKTYVDLYFDSTADYFEEAQSAVDALDIYDSETGVTAENMNDAQVAVDMANDKLAVVDPSAEKSELEEVVSRVQNYIYIVNIDASVIKLESGNAGDKLSDATGESGFAGGWYKENDFTGTPDDSVAYDENGMVELNNTSVYRKFLYTSNRMTNVELQFGFKADVKDGALKFCVTDTSGIGVYVTVSQDSLTLDVPNMSSRAVTTAPLQSGFNGVVTVGIEEGVVRATAMSDKERQTTSAECDYSWDVDAFGYASTGESKFGDFTFQKYPDGYGADVEEALDEVEELIEEKSKAEAIEKFDAALKNVNALADGVIKNDLTAYASKQSATIDVFREDIKVAEAEAALSKVNSTKVYTDFTLAKEAVEKVSAADERRAGLDAKLAEAKAMIEAITPYVKTAEIEGSWSVGSTLTAKYTVQDDCGTGSDNIVEWLAGGAVVATNTNSLAVSSNYAGKTIILRVTPTNIFGVKGTPYTSIGITIPSNNVGGYVGGSTGGSTGGNKGGVTVNVYTTPAPTTTQAPQNKFKDIENHWAKDIIEKLTEENVINGVSENEFAPDENITRAQFATLVYRVLGLAKSNTSSFSDVADNAWYAEAVNALSDAGVVSGSDGAFMPDSNITREAMAKILVAAYEYKLGRGDEKAELTFEDNGDISDWAVEAVAKAVNKSLLKGNESNQFMPKKNATRAEAASAINNLINGLEGK